MTDLNLALACPACASAMDVGALVCACGVRVEGQFETNEFANKEPFMYIQMIVQRFNCTHPTTKNNQTSSCEKWSIFLNFIKNVFDFL